MQLNSVLLDAIEKEKKGCDYICAEEDRRTLTEMMNVVNNMFGTDINYLAQVDAYNIPGAGTVYADYIERFGSESVRGYLIPQIVSDKVKDCDTLVLHLYKHFRQSGEFIANPNCPSPSHIYIRYDNAFRQLKSKRIVEELVNILSSPRDALYLPFTLQMLASWKLPELKKCLITYLHSEQIPAQSLGITDADHYYPPMTYIRRELVFRALLGLKYYPSNETNAIIQQFVSSKDKDISLAAKKTLRFMR